MTFKMTAAEAKEVLSQALASSKDMTARAIAYFDAGLISIEEMNARIKKADEHYYYFMDVIEIVS